MKFYIALCFVLTALLHSCSPLQQLHSGVYFDHFSKKKAHHFIGEYANLYSSSSGLLGLRYGSSGGESKGGVSIIDLSLSSEDPKGKLVINGKSFARYKMKKIGSQNESFVFCAPPCSYYNATCYCNENETKQFYGKELSLAYYYDTIEMLKQSLYLPSLIELSFANNNTTSTNHPTLKRSNFVVNWNKDEKNEWGVLLSIACTYGDHNQHHLKKSIRVEDTGSFNFDPNAFEDIPEGSRIIVSAMRGRLPIVKDVTGKDFKIRLSSEFSQSVTLTI